MANIKRNKIITHSIVAAGTLLACIGIWSSVTNSPQPYAATAAQPIVSVEPGSKTGQVSVPAPTITQPVTVQPTPPVKVPQVVPVQPAPTPVVVQPAPIQTPQVTTPAPTPYLPVARQAPRLRTRGS